MTKNNLYYLLVLSAHSLLWAADVPGTLDTSFNPTGTPPGTATVVIGDSSSKAYGIALQQNGHIVLVGDSDPKSGDSYIALAQLAVDGSLIRTTTASFIPDNDPNSTAYGVAVQQDGKIVVVGKEPTGVSVFGIARFNQDLSLDDTFNTIGTATTRIGSEDNASAGSSVAIQEDGKIVVAGSVNSEGKVLFGVARFNDDGSLDASFGVGSDIHGTVVVTSLVDYEIQGLVNIALQHDGSIILAGSLGNEGFVTRLTADGLLDTSFGKEGIVIIENFSRYDLVNVGLAIQHDDKIIVCGVTPFTQSIPPFLALARLNSNGAVDESFNGTGRISTTIDNMPSLGAAVTIQHNGKIVATGTGINIESGTMAFGVARFNPNGTLDTTFNPAGAQPGTASVAMGINDFVTGVALQTDGKIVLGGTKNGNIMAATRFFGGGGDVPSGNSLFIQRLIEKYHSRV